MKALFILFIGLLVSGGAMAQSCFPEGIYFEHQAQIDSFQYNYPNCAEIEGDVFIRGITDLNGLSVLTSVGGDLVIGYSSFLGQGNPLLTSLSGLENLTSIGGGLWISKNDALTSIMGLENLPSIGGNLVINHNETLTNLTGLDNVTTIGGYLSIYYNFALTSLTGLENIEAESIEDLTIEENPYLSTCEVLSVCDYLANPNGLVNIYGNAPGCNSPEEVQDSCEANGVSIDEQHIKNNLVIYPNPSSTHITIELPTTPQKNTSLTIYSLNGQQLITQPITEPQTVVDVSGLPRGVYFVKVADDEKVMMGKVVKQ